MATRCFIEIRVDNERQRQEQEAEYRNDDSVVNAGEKAAEQPEEDDGYARKSEGEYCK